VKRLIATMALVGASLAVAGSAQAQEIQLRGPLAGARSVARLVRYREGRIAITPMAAITIQDEFSREIFFGLRGEYHFTDWLGVGLMGAIAPVHIDTSLTEQITAGSPGNTGNVPNRTYFPQQVARRNWMADLHVSFIPLRGKFALFQSLVADVDFFLFGGVAFVGVSERRASTRSGSGAVGTAGANGNLNGLPYTVTTDNRRRLEDDQRAQESGVSIAPTFGAGLNFYINRFISINFEYRATPFSYNTSGTDESSTLTRCGINGSEACDGIPDYVASYFERNPNNRYAAIDSNDRSLHFNQMVSLGVSIYLPTGPQIGQ